MKRKSLIVGISLAIIILGLIGVVITWNNNSNSSNQVQSGQLQPSTSIQHDNSGAGADTGNSVIQDHMQHALQHLGL